MKPHLLLPILLTISLSCLPNTAAMADDMTTADNVREGLFAGLVLIDYKQSTDMKHHPGIHEINPVVSHFSGKHPSDPAFSAWCAGTVAAHYAISTLLPRDARHIWQYVTLSVEGANVVSNFSIGLRMSF